MTEPPEQGAATTVDGSVNPIVRLLEEGQAVFGIFSGEHTREQGVAMVSNREADFVFYSLESGPFDIPAMEAYMEGLADGSAAEGTPPPPMALRIPPIRDDPEAARRHAREGLDAGVDALVFPHVETPEEAALAVELAGEASWPGNPRGGLVNMLLIEDVVGIGNARPIASTAGVSVVFPGPGDLRRAYDRDAEAVEDAIQAVLAACRESGVPCGITAGVDDMAERLRQGFRVIIVTDPAALTVGLRASGRIR
ncbi:MAG TPA: aldolase/citrate lyase family protein [Longimicrobiales bacterium]|nr:aldolase/citrate lyase family protein [Longimicrobiales bacterium]